MFRIVKSPDMDSDEFVDSMLSRAAKGLPPRAGTPEETHPLIHEGISVYDTPQKAAATARRLRSAGRGVGDYVAELLLAENTDVLYLPWGPRGHLTVWGDPIKLAESAVDTIPID